MNRNIEWLYYYIDFKGCQKDGFKKIILVYNVMKKVKGMDV